MPEAAAPPALPEIGPVTANVAHVGHVIVASDGAGRRTGGACQWSRRCHLRAREVQVAPPKVPRLRLEGAAAPATDLLQTHVQTPSRKICLRGDQPGCANASLA